MQSFNVSVLLIQPVQTVEQPAELLVIWDTVMLCCLWREEGWRIKWGVLFDLKYWPYLLLLNHLDVECTEETDIPVIYTDGLVQDCSNSSAVALELLQPWTQP